MEDLRSSKLFADEIHRCKHIACLNFLCRHFNEISRTNDD